LLRSFLHTAAKKIVRSRSAVAALSLAHAASVVFGNKDRLQFNRISRETRGGTVVVLADPIWPKIETQAITITGLTREQVWEAQTRSASCQNRRLNWV
jgi:hypothetical protein